MINKMPIHYKSIFELFKIRGAWYLFWNIEGCKKIKFDVNDSRDKSASAMNGLSLQDMYIIGLFLLFTLVSFWFSFLHLF